MELRITAGKFKNLRLAVPDSARPLMERVKLAVFSIISDKIEGAHVLDLFAGSGALGLEALSRGAASALFIDNDYFAIKAIRENVQQIQEKFRENLKAEGTRDDVLKHVGDEHKNYDIIFVDPPYGTSNIHLFKILDQIVSPGGIVLYLNDHSDGVFEKIGRINPALKLYDTRKYGVTYVDIFTQVRSDLA